MHNWQQTHLEENQIIKRSFKYFFLSIYKPGLAFKHLQKEKSFSVGFFLNLFKWTLCELYIYYLFYSNQVLFAKPWLNIPTENYRYYELFYYIPYGILIWIFISGLAQFLSKVFGGKGTFKDCLNITGIMIFTPFVFIDTIDAIYMIINQGNWSLEFNSITRTIYVVWSLILLMTGLKVIHKIGWTKAFIISLICNGITLLINIIFIR